VTSDIDWKMLRHKATEVAAHAYAPYSGFAVGAAALVDDRRMVAGCNVENVSYGLGLCAECAVVCALHSGGGPDLLIDHPLGPRPLSELLPDAFGPADLARPQRLPEEEVP
jgi:cytidine deaminase